MIGRIGSWDVGLIDMQTQKTDNLSSENFGVLRLRRQVINAYSYMGTILTSRMGRDGSYNYSGSPTMSISSLPGLRAWTKNNWILMNFVFGIRLPVFSCYNGEVRRV